MPDLVPPPAHVADHWIVYIAYSMPVIVVVAAVATSAIRERARRRGGADGEGEQALSPEEPPGDGPGNP